MRATIVFTVVVAGIFGSPPRDAVRAQADPPGDVNDVMLDEIDGFTLADESTGQAGALTREFTGADGELQIIGFSVATPPGAEALFAASRTMGGFKFLEGLEFIDHPSIPSARWLVSAGTLPGENGLTELFFATREHIFLVILNATDPSFDGPTLVESVARAQAAKDGPVSDSGVNEPVATTEVEGAPRAR